MYTCITFGRLRKLLFAHRWAFELEFYRHMGYEEVDEWFWDQMLECLVEEADRQDLRALWERELSLPLPQFATGADLVAMLRNVVNPLLYVFLELDQPPPTHFLPEWKEPEPKYSPRLSTEHYIVVEAVDANDKPVSGVRLELLIADGEIKSATTGSDGIARVERIQAGNVVIRVLGLDGRMWEPVEGAPSQPSPQAEGFRWHEVKKGECLSKIAHRYGLKDWKVVWNHPKNEPLRNKRKSPHVLWPGDQVAVPRESVHEIVRATDATHRIRVHPGAMQELRIRMQDFGMRPLEGLAYTLRYEHHGSTVERPGRSATGPDGTLTEEVPIAVERVQLSFERPKITLALRVGYLDPPHNDDEPVESGIEARLSGLGYTSSSAPDMLRTALAAFQRDHLKRENAGGEPDPETLSKLQELYGV